MSETSLGSHRQPIGSMLRNLQAAPADLAVHAVSHYGGADLRASAKKSVRASKAGGATAAPARRAGNTRGAAPARAAMQARGDSLREQAYALIKERIIKLTYPPGMYINEAQVSADLGIGRTPVHMAINLLAQEDLVEIVPRKGVIVRPMSLDDIQSVFEARLLNEPAAAALAAQRATAEDLQALQQIVRDGQALKKPTPDQLIASDRAFHLALADATKNRVLSQLLRTLHDRALRQWYVTYQYVSDGHEDNLSQHAAMVAALVARDAPQAERLMRAHIQRTVSVFGRQFPQLSAPP